jgi:hypothetical protein
MKAITVDWVDLSEEDEDNSGYECKVPYLTTLFIMREEGDLEIEEEEEEEMAKDVWSLNEMPEGDSDYYELSRHKSLEAAKLAGEAEFLKRITEIAETLSIDW